MIYSGAVHRHSALLVRLLPPVLVQISAQLIAKLGHRVIVGGSLDPTWPFLLCMGDLTVFWMVMHVLQWVCLMD